MLNLEDIKNEVIEEGYSELKSTAIDVAWQRINDGLMTYGDLYFLKNGIYRVGGYYIDAHPILKKTGEQVVKGGFAHELGHIVKDIKQTRKEANMDVRRYRCSRTYFIKDEICTDLEAINRGFGNEVLEFQIFRETENNYNGYGITSEQIKYIISILKDFPFEFTYQDYINLSRNSNGNGRNRR